MSSFRTSALLGLAFTSLSLALGACGNFVSVSDDGESSCDGAPRPLTDAEHDCPPVWECIDGEWRSLAGACPQPACPMSLPNDGEACSFEGQNCFYEDFYDCGGGGGTVTATCTEGSWQTAWPRCSPPLECPDDLPIHGSDCTGWDYAYYCQYTAEKTCGDGMAIARCDYVNSNVQTWNVELVAETTCGGCRDHQTVGGCSADPECRWLVPATCGDDPIAEEGCFPKDDCTVTGCNDDSICAEVDVDPCWNSLCDACSMTVSVCLPG